MTVLYLLVTELVQAECEVALVLDDYHAVDSPPVHEGPAHLVERLPANAHLVVLTRADPPWPLARWRARGLVTELRSANLRFTFQEASAFLNEAMGQSLSAEDVRALEARTEGWVVGLQLAALSLRGRADVSGFIEALSGTNRFVLDFLVEEVLSREPEEVQAFLLETSILSRLSGPLCDGVTERTDSQEMLERLERRNLFVVPLDDDRRWYRYHHLFADLLQARLHQSGPDPVARLFSRATEWCEREGLIAEAVGTDEIETVWSWLDALPESVVRSSAPLSIACCWVLWHKGQIGPIEARLVDAERLGRAGCG